jgi:hypothetical protein
VATLKEKAHRLEVAALKAQLKQAQSDQAEQPATPTKKPADNSPTKQGKSA